MYNEVDVIIELHMLAHYTKHTTSVFSVDVCSLCAYGSVGDLLIHTQTHIHRVKSILTGHMINHWMEWGTQL